MTAAAVERGTLPLYVAPLYVAQVLEVEGWRRVEGPAGLFYEAEALAKRHQSPGWDVRVVPEEFADYGGELYAVRVRDHYRHDVMFDAAILPLRAALLRMRDRGVTVKTMRRPGHRLRDVAHNWVGEFQAANDATAEERDMVDAIGALSWPCVTLAGAMLDALDDEDQALFARYVAAFNKQQGPRVGDFVQFRRGVVKRLNEFSGRGTPDACVQVSDQSEYHLGDGYVRSFGDSRRTVPVAALVETDRTAFGRVWISHHGVAGGVDAPVWFRVFTCDREAPQ